MRGGWVSITDHSCEVDGSSSEILGQFMSNFGSGDGSFGFAINHDL